MLKKTAENQTQTIYWLLMRVSQVEELERIGL